MQATQHLDTYFITPGTLGGCSKTIKFIIVIVFYNDSKAQTLKDKLISAPAVVMFNSYFASALKLLNLFADFFQNLLGGFLIVVCL